MSNMAFLFLSHLAVLPMSQSLARDLTQPKRFERLTIYAYLIITVGNVAFGLLLVVNELIYEGHSRFL